MENNNRFSVMLLEKDVLEYHNYKTKYNEYYEKCANCSIKEKEELEKKKKYWYNRYIKKMKYLEENYRKTNVYTQYHAQLENGYLPQDPIRPPRYLPTRTEEEREIQEIPVAQPVLVTQVERLNNDNEPSAPSLEEENNHVFWEYQNNHFPVRERCS